MIVDSFKEGVKVFLITLAFISVMIGALVGTAFAILLFWIETKSLKGGFKRGVNMLKDMKEFLI